MVGAPFFVVFPSQDAANWMTQAWQSVWMPPSQAVPLAMSIQGDQGLGSPDSTTEDARNLKKKSDGQRRRISEEAVFSWSSFLGGNLHFRAKHPKKSLNRRYSQVDRRNMTEDRSSPHFRAPIRQQIF